MLTLVGVVADYEGALLGTWLLTRLLRWLCLKRVSERDAAVAAFIGSLMVCVAVTPITFGYDKDSTVGLIRGLILYFPCLALWVIIDLYRAASIDK